MLAPISWLKDYVQIDVSPEQLAKKLVAIGFEVEDIIYQSKRATGVVVARITEVEKHPNADRLRVIKADIGDKVLQVVTNVPVTGGEVCALALDGALLTDGREIKKGELRGVLSEGMLCGLEELGLSVNDVDGQKEDDIVRFSDGERLGRNALEALGYDDVILDVAVTANRPDCNSIYKLAKEVAVALGTECREPHINWVAAGESVREMISVDVQNSDLCPRYMAAGVRNICVRESSDLVKRRLRAVGIRPINNIVDITNYVLTEIGQPMHAFDLSLLEGRRIVVRNAREGENIVTLDGKNNRLEPSMLVICDEQRPVAVAGIMGGLGSGINADTKDIIFESAKFARDSVRRTSRKLNLRSDSSARFEKGIDLASQKLALDRALTMIYETGAGEIASDMYDRSVDLVGQREIKFTIRQLKDILGCNVPKKTLISILAKLGIEVVETDGTLVARVGEDREDIVGVNDIAEEFIRVYGYRHIKPTLFKYAELTEGGVPEKILAADAVRDALVGCGLSECTTYSFTSPKFSAKLRLPEDDERRDTVTLMNPIGEALSVMRTTLTHSMLETLAYNYTHFNDSAKLFEIARVYLPVESRELPDEREKLVVGLYGEGQDYFSLKGTMENALGALNVKEVRYARSKQPFLHPGRSADIFADGEYIGYMGEAHPDVAADYGVDNERLYVGEIFLDALYKDGCLTGQKFRPFTKFPTVERDLALVVDDSVAAQDMVDAVRKARVNDLIGIRVFDTYKSDAIGRGKKSVAIRFYFAALDRTLKDAEVAESIDKILAALKRRVKAKIRL